MNRILLVEDHERLAELIRQQLATVGIPVDIFSRIDTALSAIQQIPYRALILDRGLPDGDGLMLIKQLRKQGTNIPCLILTARDALHDRVQGLDMGADDYLTKPFEMEEMVARVRALLRRPNTNIDLDPQFGDLTVKTTNSTLCCGSHNVLLPPTELQIILYLLKKNGNVARRSALEAAAWGLSEAVTPNALDVALHRLRRKLKQIGSQLQIVNVRNLGYALREINVVQ